MWSATVVVSPPTLDDDPGLLERLENLPVEQLIAHPGIEALDATVRPANTDPIRICFSSSPLHVSRSVQRVSR